MERILHIVAGECRPEIDKQFNDWYNDVHVPMLLKYPGIKKVTRYRQTGQPGECPQYLTVYEYDTKEDQEGLTKSPELAAAIAEMQETWKEGGPDIKWSGVYEPIKSWEK